MKRQHIYLVLNFYTQVLRFGLYTMKIKTPPAIRKIKHLAIKPKSVYRRNGEHLVTLTLMGQFPISNVSELCSL